MPGALISPPAMNLRAGHAEPTLEKPVLTGTAVLLPALGPAR